VSKIFDDGWARRFGFASGSGEPVVGDVLGGHGWDGELPVVDPADSIGAALKLMRATGSTHLAVSSAPPPVRFAEIVGTVAETTLTERVAQGQVRLTDSIATHMSAVLPTVGRGQSVAETARTVAGAGAALVLDGGLPCGIVTPRDIVAALELPTPA
jgi:cystathionine beta-synthase